MLASRVMAGQRPVLVQDRKETRPLVTVAMSGSIRALGLHPTVDNGSLFISTDGLAFNLSALGLLLQGRS